MDTLAALEAALRESPDDSALLAAITDYFLERNDLRGEYIQAVLAGDKATHTRLYAAHCVEWVAPLAFDSSVRLIGWHYCWLTGVRLNFPSDEQIDGLRQLPLLRSLEIGDFRPEAEFDPMLGWLGDALVTRLIASGIIDRLDTLRFDDAGITDEGAVALAACPAVAKLRDLKLHRCQVSEIGLDALTRVGHWNVGEQNLTPWRDRPDVL